MFAESPTCTVWWILRTRSPVYREVVEPSTVPARDPRPVRVPAQRAPVRDGEILITGDVRAERVIRTADLRAHAQEPLDVHYVTDHVREIHRVQGVALHKVLRTVVLRVDERCRKDHLSFAVLARSQDGYRVLLSMAEIDPAHGACSALLATSYNGRLLSLPTLVLPCDGRASRYVRDLCRLDLVRVGP